MFAGHYKREIFTNKSIINQYFTPILGETLDLKHKLKTTTPAHLSNQMRGKTPFINFGHHSYSCYILEYLLFYLKLNMRKTCPKWIFPFWTHLFLFRSCVRKFVNKNIWNSTTRVKHESSWISQCFGNTK